MIFQSIAGLLVFTAVAYLLSENRKDINPRIVVVGLVLQLLIGFLLLKIPLFRQFFEVLNKLVLFLQASTTAGTSFVFGYLGGGSLPFDEKFPGASYVLAFRGLPLILLVSALSSLLFYWKIMPQLVKGFSWALQKSMGVGGAEGVGLSANVFVGMVEAPLFVRPYLSFMTRSELFTLMTCGMATIAGTVMVLYASFLVNILPEAMGHILTASIISVPAAITVSKIMIPETASLTTGEMVAPDEVNSSMDAISRGTIQGIKLLINIVAMLVVLVALVHLLNLFLGLLPELGGKPITLQRVLGVLMAPVVWLMGVPWKESLTAGTLLGTKIILNEFIAYMDLSQLPKGALNPLSTLIMLYAMCGFANPGSLGIMIGGMGTMAPDRRGEIVALGLRSVVAGIISTCMTGAVVGIIGRFT